MATLCDQLNKKDWVCIVCREGNTEELGSVLEPCKCHNQLSRFHYHCLAIWIESCEDSPCAHCQNIYINPGIERYRENGPNFWQYTVSRHPLLNLNQLQRHCIYSQTRYFIVILLTMSMFVIFRGILYPSKEGFHWLWTLVLIGLTVYVDCIDWHEVYVKYMNSYYPNPHQMIKFKHWLNKPSEEKIIDITLLRIQTENEQ